MVAVLESVRVVEARPGVPEGTVGRVCRKNYEDQTCCVMFREIGCVRIDERCLEPTSEEGPLCSLKCNQGC